MSESKYIKVPRKLFAEILTEAVEHHPRPHYTAPLVPCGGPGVCVDEVNFQKGRELLGMKGDR